jgi:hypothetical protein
MTYSGKIGGVEQSIKFNSSKELTMKIEGSSQKLNYVEHKGHIVIVGSDLAADAYKEMKKQRFIANPLYDSVFKFLMEDEIVARTLLSAL